MSKSLSMFAVLPTKTLAEISRVLISLHTWLVPVRSLDKEEGSANQLCYDNVFK